MHTFKAIQSLPAIPGDGYAPDDPSTHAPILDQVNAQQPGGLADHLDGRDRTDAGNAGERS